MTPKRIPTYAFESSAITLVPKDQLPMRQGPKGVFKHLSIYPDILKLLAEIKKEGVAPFEEAAIIDLSKLPQRDKAYLKQKNPSMSFYLHLRSLAKKMGITGQVEFRRIGQQIAIVGG